MNVLALREEITVHAISLKLFVGHGVELKPPVRISPILQVLGLSTLFSSLFKFEIEVERENWRLL